MTQIAATTVTSAAAHAPEAVLQQTGETAQNGGFADLLALQTPTESAAPAVPGEAPALTVQLTEVQVVAAPAAASGKTLPASAAAIAALVTGKLKVEEPAAEPKANVRPEAAPLPLVLLSRAPAALLAAAKPAKAPAQPATTDDEPTTPAAPEAVLFATLHLAATNDAPPASKQADAAPRPAAATQPNLLVALALPVPGQPTPAALQAPAQAAATSDQRVLEVGPVRPDQLPVAAFTLADAPLAQPGKAVHLRPQFVEAAMAFEAGKPAELAASAKVDTPLMQPAADPVVAPNSAPSLAPAHATPASTHDFAAVVDRLIAARDMAQPQAVSLALDHADFGKVSLHFRQDDGALSVSVSAADPDFARAVQSALPSADTGSASSNSGNAPQHFGARADNAPQANANGQRESSNRGADQRASTQPAANRSASSTDPEAKTAARGRFA